MVWQHAAQREREAELLAVGVEFARALGRYRDETPLGTPPWPAELVQLVEARRHLRRIYRDPLTGRAQWGLVMEGGFIVGVHSLANSVPLRRHELPQELGGQGEQAASYTDWVFRPVVP